MEAEETKGVKAPRGVYCGYSVIHPHGVVDVFTKNNQFCIAHENKFIQFVKESVLRREGIAVMQNGRRKQIFGKQGFVGCPKS